MSTVFEIDLRLMIIYLKGEKFWRGFSLTVGKIGIFGGNLILRMASIIQLGAIHKVRTQ